MTNIPITENEQRKLYIEKNNDRGDLYCEVPVFSRSIDLVRLDGIQQSITAIEFKKHNWKCAIKQAKKVSISFDFLEICVIEPKTIELKFRIIDECQQNGIGLCFYNYQDKEFYYELLPKRVDRTWDVQKQHVLEYLRKVAKNE
jgi:hypothetical protein